MTFPFRLLVSSMVILVLIYLLPGLYSNNLLTTLGVSVTLGAAITMIKPFILMVLHQEISLKIYGIIMFITCVFMLYINSILFDGFVVGHFLAAIGLGIIVTGISVVITSMKPSA
ncbi:hypothetical protein MASR1M74_31630 [Lentimicrobium sp.]